jgi:hypothetical protein
MKMALIRRVSTEYFEIDFPTVFCSPAKEFPNNFPSTFRRMNHQKQHQRDSIPRPSDFQSTTLPLRHTLFMFNGVLYVKLCDSTIFSFLGKEPSTNSNCKRLWSLRFNFEESISLGWESIPGLLIRSTNMGLINWWNLFFGIYSWAP